MIDRFKIKGKLNIIVKDKDGNIKLNFTTNNLVVNSGFSFIASRMEGTSSNVMSHMAVGTDNTAATLSQTSLIAEVERSSLSSTTVNQSDITYIATFDPSSEFDLYEAGIFNASSGGTMLCRTTFPLITKTAEDTITINWTISVVG